MNDSARVDALLAYVQSSAFPSRMSRKPQLGLYYLAQHATDAGYQVRVDELSAGDQVVRRLCWLADEYVFPLLGLYVDHDNIWDLHRILPVLKQERPELQIVLGGPEMTANAEGTMSRLPQAICGCIGEGEEVFVELLSLPALSPEHLAACRGLAVREDDRIVFTPPREPIERLDRLSIPLRRELNVDGVYRQPGSMITGRGCPGRCAFCFEGRNLQGPKRLRLHSVERCLEEFDYLVREYNARYISILDDTFVADTGRLRAFCHGLIHAYQGSRKWYCEARADSLARHPDLLPLMVEAGLVRLQIGGESGDQRILDVYRKGVSLEQIVEVVEQASSADLLSVFINFIVGGAFETPETYERTREFALGLMRLAPGRVAVAKSFYTPYPGTPMYDDPGAYGLQVQDWDTVTGRIDQHVFCRTEELSKHQILALGQDFDEHKDETMRELALGLPFALIQRALIERHFWAEHHWALSTEWHEFLARDPAMRNYFDAVVRVGALDLQQAVDRSFAGCYPMRTVEPVSRAGQGYAIRGPLGREQHLDSLESLVYELSAGKLSFEEILGRIADHLSIQDSSDLRGEIVECYRRFDRDYLVVWPTT
jgi:anaerobic magnesium-protoporphyrin IX monomethyl ester cyclase